MEGVDRINKAIDLSIQTNKEKSNFIVKCVYDNFDNVISISGISKLTWQLLHGSTYIRVIRENNKTLLYVGSGKVRSGYTRSIFQKKFYQSDSAIVINDTMIFKTTSAGFFSIKIYTKINTENINLLEMVFLYNKKNRSSYSSLSSFENYKQWFSLNDISSSITGGVIRLKQPIILHKENIKSDGSFFSSIDITTDRLQERKICLYLFIGLRIAECYINFRKAYL